MALKAAIAGGGLGGLAAATALAQRGWEITIFERQPALRAAGSGIYIWENGLKVLGALDADSDVLQNAFRGLAFEQRDKNGTIIDPGPMPVDIASWKESFPQWAHLIERIGNEVSWGVYSTIKVRSWSACRAAVIGDAAHAQPPNLGQGGGMTMQNGLAMAVYLKDIDNSRDIPNALALWEQNERELVDRCQKWSCLYGELTYLPDQVRATIVSNAMANPWMQAQFRRAAESVPTGTT